MSFTEKQATDALAAAGLAVGKVQHRQDPVQAGKVLQHYPATGTVTSGSKVDLVVAVSLAPPNITGPTVNLNWGQQEPWVGAWRVSTSKQTCEYYFADYTRNCRFDAQANTTVTGRSYNASFQTSYQPSWGILGWYNTGLVPASVAALDDFGNAGPSDTVEFRIR